MEAEWWESYFTGLQLAVQSQSRTEEQTRTEAAFIEEVVGLANRTGDGRDERRDAPTEGTRWRFVDRCGQGLLRRMRASQSARRAASSLQVRVRQRPKASNASCFAGSWALAASGMRP